MKKRTIRNIAIVVPLIVGAVLYIDRLSSRYLGYEYYYYAMQRVVLRAALDDFTTPFDSQTYGSDYCTIEELENRERKYSECAVTGDHSYKNYCPNHFVLLRHCVEFFLPEHIYASDLVMGRIRRVLANMCPVLLDENHDPRLWSFAWSMACDAAGATNRKIVVIFMKETSRQDRDAGIRPPDYVTIYSPH